jgi:hypothetical protein
MIRLYAWLLKSDLHLSSTKAYSRVKSRRDTRYQVSVIPSSVPRSRGFEPTTFWRFGKSVDQFTDSYDVFFYFKLNYILCMAQIRGKRFLRSVRILTPRIVIWETNCIGYFDASIKKTLHATPLSNQNVPAP